MTASRALGPGTGVAADKLARVREVAAELGYVRTRPPAHLSPKSVGLIGVIIPSIADSIFAEFLQGIEAAAGPRNYDILLGVSQWDSKQEEAVVRGLLSRQPDGLVFAGRASPASAALLAGQLNWLRTAETWEDIADPVDISVGFDNFAAGQLAAQHFLDAGYRDLFFCGPTGGRDGLRCDGFVQTAARGAIRAEIIRGEMPWADGETPEDMADMASVIDHVRNRSDGPAIFCATDEIAYALIFEAARRGLRIPDQLAICGCGDRPLSAFIEPRLTTVRIPTAEMGYQAVQKLIDVIHGGAPTDRNTLHPELKIRSTV